MAFDRRRSTTPRPAAASAGYHLSARRRATFSVLVRAVCPPDVTTLGLVEPVVDHVERSISAIGAFRQRLVELALDGLEAGSFVRHRSTLPRAGHDRAVAWMDGLAESRAAPVRQATRLLRDLAVMGYYDQPLVKQRLGYDPDAWTATVAPARALAWSDAIRRHQEVLVQPSPAPRRAAG